jgi:hypothetical protein
MDWSRLASIAIGMPVLIVLFFVFNLAYALLHLHRVLMDWWLDIVAVCAADIYEMKAAMRSWWKGDL